MSARTRRLVVIVTLVALLATSLIASLAGLGQS